MTREEQALTLWGMAVTLADVARAAGVSLATASRAINGSATRTVRPELRDRVLAVAAELRYSPDANAQAMARGRTSALGLIVHDIADPYFSAIAAGVSAAADGSDLMVTLGNSQHDPRREVALVGVLHRQRVRAIIIAGGRIQDPTLNAALGDVLGRYRESGGAVTMISQPVLDVDTVVIDNEAGAASLAAALCDRGYRRFAVLAGPDDHLTAAERRHGFHTEVTRRGLSIDPEHALPSAFTRDGGYAAMAELIARTPIAEDLDAVFCVNDVMAVGAVAAARDAGIRVGVDVGVAGFDDIATLRDLSPALTTVALPLHRIGELATRLALGIDADLDQDGRGGDGAGRDDDADRAEHPDRDDHLRTARTTRVGGKVVLRDSTPPLT